MTNAIFDDGALPRLLTVEDVADYLQISLSKAYQIVREGALPSVTLGRCVRVKADDLAEYIRRSSRYGFEE